MTTPTTEQLKASLRATWMAGDFGVIAKTIESGGEDFAAALTLSGGSKVLDVACGTGNVALPLARSGCVVTGVDIAPNLLEQARRRASAENLSITFDEGDAEQLPYADSSFDAVVTMFGAMFAPHPDVVASELARVLKPGGLLAMANWNPASFSGQMFRLMNKHVPPPPGMAAPILWGEEAVAHQRLSPFFDSIETTIVPISFDMPTGPEGVVEMFRTYFGPTKVAFSRLDNAGQAALSADFVRLWSEANQASNPQHQTYVPNQYLRVIARRR